MAKKLTGTESIWSQPFLHDLFEAGGLLKRPVRSYSGNYITSRGFTEQAETICNEIKFRNFDFPKTNDAIRRIAMYTYVEPLHAGKSGDYKKLKDTQIANIIAAFCAEHEIFWDDVNTHRTTVEMDTYRKTLLGNACWNFKCFLSQQAEKKPARAAAKRAVDPATGKIVPKSGYKSSGPKSGLIGGLIGEPGEKIILPASTCLALILCKSTKAKKQYVFVDPIANKAEINKVKLGDPSGYSACKLFFDSIDAAENALAVIESGAIKIPVDISGFELVKQKVDPNGYFKIATDVGPAYIKASKLNEAADKDMVEGCGTRIPKFPPINDIDVYSEAFCSFE